MSLDPFNAFTRVFDVPSPAGEGPLKGLRFAVKDLFDIAGLTTTAGAKMRIDAAPAKCDAEVVARLKTAGAVLVGTLNMDEYAYGFATVNAHFGTTKNPCDLERLAGGSSGGSAAAVAAGLVPLALGSDTNGSIRVPASLCGVWGMRPAEGAVPLDGVFPFVDLLDTVGPFTRSVGELKTAYEVLSATTMAAGSVKPRVARLTGFFARGASDEVLAAVGAVAGSAPAVDLPLAEAARSAAFLITAARGGVLHLDTLRGSAMDYDPAVRDRLIAGAMLPAAALLQAMELRALWRQSVTKLFDDYDILIAPATPVTAPRIDDGTIVMDGKAVSARANLGIYAQPISLAGAPVISAPVRRTGLPIGVQVITAPGREALAFDFCQALEEAGILGFTPPPAFAEAA